MEQLLNKGTSISDLAYLRVLQLVHIQASLLVEDLKAYELPSGISRSPSETADFRRNFSTGPTPAASGPSAAVSTMLETSLEELFVPYTEGQRYLERESRSLGTLYSSLLVNFTRYHVGIYTFAVSLSKIHPCLFRKEHTKGKHRCLIEW
jgi:exocyst complex component 5